MMFFGLDEEGLINNHVFDQKIRNFRPKPLAAIGAMPWLRPGTFSGEVVGGQNKAPGRLVYAIVGADGVMSADATWTDLLSEVQDE